MASEAMASEAMASEAIEEAAEVVDVLISFWLIGAVRGYSNLQLAASSKFESGLRDERFF